MLKDLARKHLTETILPFWNGLKDDEFGGFYGRLSLELELDKKAEKGVILNSRIMWFYSNAYFALGDEGLLKYAHHSYEFMKNYCIDRENGGVFWSMNYDGTVNDSTKHTYNQAFAIYALSSYYAATKQAGEDAQDFAQQVKNLSGAALESSSPFEAPSTQREKNLCYGNDAADALDAESDLNKRKCESSCKETGSAAMESETYVLPQKLREELAAEGREALAEAWKLFEIIETKCRDEIGYLESFNRRFEPEENDKLSENGVIAHKTMNSLLHIYEAYSELYRVTGDGRPKERLEWILDTFADKVYNPKLRRQEVFFDKYMNSIIDLHSYGHDIEASWLIDRGCDIIGEESYKEKIFPITQVLADNILKTAYHKSSLWNECERGVNDKTRVWWVQAEAVLGFLNAYRKEADRKEFLEAAEAVYGYIMETIVDKRPGSEWLSEVDDDGRDTVKHKDIVEPWKCPYHNGRMCFELMKGEV